MTPWLKGLLSDFRGFFVICLCWRMVGSLKMNTTLEYSTRVVQEGDRRCKNSTLNYLAYLTPLRIHLMNPGVGTRFLLTSVADPDPGSCDFLTPGPGSGIRNRFFSVSRIQTNIFGMLVTNFWVKSSIILRKLFFLQHIKNKLIYIFVKFVATKKDLWKQIFFSPLSFVAVFGWVKIRIRDPG